VKKLGFNMFAVETTSILVDVVVVQT